MESKIKLTQDKYALVDPEDYEYLNQWRWYYGAKGAAVRTQYLGGGRKTQRRKMYYMHRVVARAEDIQEVDHINHDTLDNRKSNLRVCDRTQNLSNTRLSKTNTSGYKGVSWSTKRNKWIAQISVNNKTKPLGAFVRIEEAVLAYNKAAIELRGEFAWINKL